MRLDDLVSLSADILSSRQPYYLYIASAAAAADNEEHIYWYHESPFKHNPKW